MYPLGWVIWNESNGLFWSNKWGWGDLSGADQFTTEDTAELNLPIGGMWLTMTAAQKLPEMDY
jgi:hypothetical protein